MKNADGSTDVYVGPNAPKGFENNWVQTKAGEGWFVLFRVYGPTEKFFDKSWVLPDFEKLKWLVMAHQPVGARLSITSIAPAA